MDQAETMDPASGTQSTRNHHGDFVWYELITPDPAAAQAFYGPILGWSFRDAGVPGMDYRIAATREADVAGVMTTPDGAAMPPAWLGYIGVDDVDAMATAIADGGGTVHMPPWDVDGVGRMAFVADPQGALFYVMRGSMDGESQSFSYDKPRPGHCAWNELSSSDPESAKRFYGKHFGWVKDGEMEMGPLGAYQFLRHAGRAPEGSPMGHGMLGAVMPLIPGGAPVSNWTFYFRVPDIDAAAAQIEASGGSLIQQPIEIPGGDFSLVAADPHGAAFGLVGGRKEAA